MAHHTPIRIVLRIRTAGTVLTAFAVLTTRALLTIPAFAQVEVFTEEGQCHTVRALVAQTQRFRILVLELNRQPVGVCAVGGEYSAYGEHGGCSDCSECDECSQCSVCSENQVQ